MSNNTITHSHQIINTQADNAKLFPNEAKARAAFIALAREKLEGSLIEEHISLNGNKKAQCPYCKDKGKDNIHSYGETFYCFGCCVGGGSLELLALSENPALKDCNGKKGKKIPCDESRTRAAEKVLNTAFSSFIGQERKPKTKAQIKKEREERDRLKREREERDRLEEAERARKAAKTLETCKAIWIQSRPDKERIIHWLVDKRYFPQALAEKAYTASKEILRYSYYEGKEQVIALEPNESLQIITFNGNLKKDEPEKMLLGPTHFLPIETDSERLVIVESLACALALSSIGISAITIFSTSNTKKMLPKIMERYSEKDVFLWLDSGEKEKELSSEACKENQGLRQVLLANKEKGFDVNDLLRENPSNFKKAVEGALNEAEKIFRGKYGNDNSLQLQNIFDEALKSSKRNWVVLSPTGSGKSTISREVAIRRLRAKKNTIFVACLKNDMKQFLNLLRDQLTEEEQENNLIVIEKDSEDKENLPNVINGKPEKPFIMVSHKTYFTRKGQTTFHYEPMTYLEKISGQFLLILDEAQNYIEAQKSTIALDTRYKEVKFRSIKSSSVQRLEECPVSATKSKANCSGCMLSKSTGYHSPNLYGAGYFFPFVPGKTGDVFEKIDYSKIFDFESFTRSNTIEVARVKRSSQSIKGDRIYKHDLERGEDPPTEEEILKDLLSCSYSPLAFVYTPTDREGNKVSPENIVDDEKAREKYIFPKYTCGVKRVSLWDKSSLEFLGKHSKKLILLGANLEEADKAFSSACLPNLQFREVEKSNHQLENVFVIFYESKLSLSSKKKVKKEEKRTGKKKSETQFSLHDLLETLENQEKILLFSPTKEKAERAYADFPKGYPISFISSNDYKTTRHKAENDKDSKIFMTYSQGPSGIGENRPFDMVTVIDGSIYKPTIDMKVTEEEIITEALIKEGTKGTATATAKQNQGRMLRVNKKNPNKPKLLIFHNCKDLDRQELVKSLKKMVKNVQELTVEECKEYLAAQAYHIVKNCQIKEESEAEFLAKQGRTSSSIGKKERKSLLRNSKEYQEAREKAKHKKKLDSLSLQIPVLVEAGKTDREIKRAINLSRIKKSNFKSFDIDIFVGNLIKNARCQ